MRKSLILLVLSSLLIGLLVQTGAKAADPSLKGWWKFDEDSGRIAADSSINGNDASLKGQGEPLWVAGQIDGALELDGDDDYVELPIGPVIESLTSGTFAIWVNFLGFSVQEDWQRILDFGRGRSDYIFLTPSMSSGGPMRVAIRTTATGGEDTATIQNRLDSGWHHVTVTISDAAQTLTLYLDGDVVAINSNLSNKLSDLGNTTNNWLGRSQYDDDPYFEGVLDDLYIYNRVLSQTEIETLMGGGGLETSIASNPNPSDGQTDVSRDLFLSWESGNFAVTHNVYFGTNFDDLNEAGPGSPLLVGPGLVINTYDIDRLEFGQRYFWRVDEVNAPPDLTVFKGNVWSFTIEPLAYPIPADNIIATASSYSQNQGPEKTVDGSGLVGDLHSTVLNDMWLSQPGEPGSEWVQYQFDKAYKMHEMLVWNYNGQAFLVALGLQSIVVEYSMDGTNWTPVENVNEFAQASGLSDYTHNTTVVFGDVPVRYVKITANNNWGGGVFFNQYGLSEVRFMQVPVSARQPEPDNGATDVAIDVILDWRAGREATEHNVYISDDEEAVIDGTAPFMTVSQEGYGPLSLNLASKYYWRVDEVNNANTVPIWEGGTWSFTTSEYLVIDDFESYNDIPEGQEGSNLVYLTWIDGYDNPSTNGSTIGYTSGASLETATVHGGRNSVPIIYDNSTASFSEVTANTSDLAVGGDWTIGSPDMLAVWFYGDPNNPATDQMYVKINGVKVIYDGDLTQEQWQEFSVDLASLGIDMSNVTSLTIGFERIGASGGSGNILLDDIVLSTSL